MWDVNTSVASPAAVKSRKAVTWSWKILEYELTDGDHAASRTYTTRESRLTSRGKHKAALKHTTAAYGNANPPYTYDTWYSLELARPEQRTLLAYAYALQRAMVLRNHLLELDCISKPDAGSVIKLESCGNMYEKIPAAIWVWHLPMQDEVGQEHVTILPTGSDLIKSALDPQLWHSVDYTDEWPQLSHQFLREQLADAIAEDTLPLEFSKGTWMHWEDSLHVGHCVQESGVGTLPLFPEKRGTYHEAGQFKS